MATRNKKYSKLLDLMEPQEQVQVPMRKEKEPVVENRTTTIGPDGRPITRITYKDALNVEGVPSKPEEPEDKKISPRAQKQAIQMIDVNDTPYTPLEEPLPIVSPEVAAPEAKEEGQGFQWDWGEALIGILPTLAGMIGGDTAIGAQIGGKGLVKRYGDLRADEKLRKKIEARRKDKSKRLSSSNLVKTIGPDGEPRYILAEQALGREAYEKPTAGSQFFLDEKKELATHQALLDKEKNKGKDAFKNEKSLRGDYLRHKTTKNTIDLTNAWNTIKGIASRPQTSGDDLALTISYMKMLDPGSVVREGEQTMVQRTGKIPDYVWNQFQRLMQGEDSMLSASARRSLVNAARGRYEDQLRAQAPIDSAYASIAEQYGLNPKNVMINPRTGTEYKMGPAAGTKAKTLPPLERGKILIRMKDGTSVQIPESKEEEFLRDFEGEVIER